MRTVTSLPIRRKLLLLSFVTSAITLLLAGIAFATYGVRRYREDLARELATQADIIGFNVTPALVFRDERAATEILGALRAAPQLLFAGVYTPDGAAFGTYVRAGLPPEQAPPSALRPDSGTGFRPGYYELTRALGTRERPLGSVYLRADLHELEASVLRYVWITVSVLGVALLASVGLASVLQKQVSEPILSLARTAQAVATAKDYRLRATGQGGDEVGVLVRVFNEMLDEIERRDGDLRAVNRQLALKSEELSRKNEEVEAFVYIVSHDLRGPLVNLQGFSRELRRSCETLSGTLQAATLEPGVEASVRELLGSDIPTSLRFISASTTKFEKLINALLQLSRTGRREFRMETLDMNSLAASTIDVLRVDIATSGADIALASLPPARGDATAIGQVLANLLSNALRYLRKGRPGRIEIGAETGGPMNTYHVKDNGSGIPEAARSRLFQVFQRFHPELAEGEGIGLATVKRIVERHGGKIWIESVEGEGTTFRFTLPSPSAAQEAVS